jgi:outer membrane receptor protein involved in Fe transport
MIRVRCSSLTALFIASALAATAQTAATPAGDNDPVIRADTVIVEEPRITADAAGVTRVRLDTIATPTAQSLSSLSGRVANLHINTGGAGSFGDLFTLRGLSNTPYFSDPSVTVYFDDLPLGSSFTYPTGLFGFATATVHRGPQATAFGRGGAGGVLVFNSSTGGDALTGELRASVANHDARSAALIARTADASIAASFSERDGYITNTTLGRTVDDQESAAVSARVRFHPSATTELSLQLLGSRQRNGAQPLVPLGGPLYSVARDGEGETHTDFGGLAFKAAFDTSIGRLSATTSYTDWELNPFRNYLVLPPDLDSQITQTQRAWNEEIRLTSAANAARAWSVGAWFSETRTEGDVNRAIPNLFPIEVSNYRLDTQTIALFGQIELISAQDWTLTAGLRAEQVKKDFDRTETVPAPGRYTKDRTFAVLLPKLTASYAISADTTATAAVSFGTKPGGWSAFTGNAALARFDAERTVAFETGIDTSLANKTVNLAARAFVYDIRDYQIERSFTFTDYLVVNAPRARSVGAEIEASWRPVPAWTFAATLGVTEITLREFTDPFTATNYTGRRAPYTPAYDANVTITYRDPSGWFVGAEATFTGKSFYDESEAAAFAQEARATLNARLGYDAARWRVALFGENLTKEDYYTLIIPGVGHGVPGAPRTYGVEAVVKW